MMRNYKQKLNSIIIVFIVAIGLCFSQMASAQSIPFIHVTDLYRPYGSPDDHWDLATVYALAHIGQFDLKGIVLENGDGRSNPDVMSVMQMNVITGLSVPMAIGSSQKLRDEKDAQFDVPSAELAGVELILSILRSSEQKVIIQITGSSRDVAVAGNREPRLFAEKCAGIYLNAGISGKRDRLILEHNVQLDPMAFSSIFKLDCPVYWNPVYQDKMFVDPELWNPNLKENPERSTELVHIYDSFKVMPFAGNFVFKQGDVLPLLTKPVQNYFGFMFRQGKHDNHQKAVTTNWLTYLNSEPETDVLETACKLERANFTLASMLHAAGYFVNKNGVFQENDKKAIYHFRPASIYCPEGKQPEWSLDSESVDRFILKVDDLNHYEKAMTSAFVTLLKKL